MKQLSSNWNSCQAVYSPNCRWQCPQVFGRVDFFLYVFNWLCPCLPGVLSGLSCCHIIEIAEVCTQAKLCSSWWLYELSSGVISIPNTVQCLSVCEGTAPAPGTSLWFRTKCQVNFFVPLYCNMAVKYHVSPMKKPEVLQEVKHTN